LLFKNQVNTKERNETKKQKTFNLFSVFPLFFIKNIFELWFVRLQIAADQELRKSEDS